MTNFEKVQEFHRVFDNSYKDPNCENRDRVLLRGKLMLEVLNEVFKELGLSLVFDIETLQVEVDHDWKFKGPINRPKVAKELADLLYVVYGSADTMDIPMDEVYAEVHRSNMSKMHPDGTVRYREDGKILKTEFYSPADIEKVLNAS